MVKVENPSNTIKTSPPPGDPNLELQNLDLAALYSGLLQLDFFCDQIGRVNPRPPGLLNNMIQLVKRIISRGMRWFVRSQTEFNAHTRTSIQKLTQQLEVVQSNFQHLAEHVRHEENIHQEITELRQRLLQARAEQQVEDAAIREQLGQMERDWQRAQAELQDGLAKKAEDTAIREQLGQMERDWQRAQAELKKQRTLQFESSLGRWKETGSGHKRSYRTG